MDMKLNNSNHKICSKRIGYEVDDVDHLGGQLLMNIYALAFIQNKTK